MQLKEGSPESAGMSSAGIARAEAAVARLVDTGNTPSVVELIARKGIIVSHKAFGTNGTEQGTAPLDAGAIYPVCSITKVVTATCVMMLVEEGRVGLNRRITDYLPEFAGEGRDKICVHHLLTHTSGLTDDDVNAHVEKKAGLEVPPCPPGRDEYLHRRLCLGRDTRPREKPGKVMSYCSFGYEMLGEIVARASGSSYEDFARTRLFEPLGMKDSYLRVPEAARGRVVRRKEPAIFAEWLTSAECMDSRSAAGGMFTTALDLAKLGAMFLSGGEYGGARLLSPVSVAAMTKNQIPGVSSEYRGEFFPEAFWGYGWGINGTKRDGGDLFSPAAYSHWGAAGPFICVDPEYDIITVFLCVEVDHHNPFKDIYADSFNDAAMAAIERA
jgi:Beta-lactamase class C and other penicillin binding proteins